MKTNILKPPLQHSLQKEIWLLLSLVFTVVFTSINLVPNFNPFSSPPVITSSFSCIAPNSLADIQPLQNGQWNNANIWPGGKLPTSNDNVTIPAGRTITLVGTCRARNLNVSGTLKAVNFQAGGAWIDIEARSIMIDSGGYMEIGTETQPYFAQKNANGISCQITLTGTKVNNAAPSYKAIMVMGGGRLELHGKEKKSWTNLASTANAGATQITLKEAVDWEVGDKIALTATGLATSNGKAWNDVDEAEIIAISGDKRTLTLKNPLQYKHVGGTKSYTRARDGKTWNVNIQGEVGLLSHYIKIQGKMDANNEQTGFGGHIMLMKNSIAHAENIELYKMGQKGILGRYPFHWHLNEDKAKGSYLRNSSVHKSFNRAVTIHGTDYVTVDGVFAYDQIGHGIFLEDGAERFNTIKNNVVFVTRRPKKGEELTPSDNEFNAPQNRTPASYWITNPNNYFENNVAAGTEGTGFWFAFPEKPLFDSGNLSYYQGLNPSKEPLGRFEGFVAHTCMTGWDVFDRLNPDHSIKTNYGWDVNERQLIKDGLFYGNDQALYCGLGAGGTNRYTVFSNCAFSDNKTGSMLAGDLTIENSLFNADSGLGVFDGVREFFRFYDGPGRHRNCHFEGWNRSNTEMIKQITGGGATENFNPTFRGTTKGFSEPFPFRFFPLPNTDATRTRKIGQFFKDYDGGLTGKAHTTLIRDIPFLTDGHEYRHSSWRNAARSDYYFAGLTFARINSSGVRLSIVRSKPGTEDVCFYESGSNSAGTYKFPMIVNEGFQYTYYFDKAPANKSINLIWNRGDEGDLGFACFKGLGKLGNFRVNGHQFNLPLLNSKEAVENAMDNAYFIAGNGDVYMKFRALGEDSRVNIFFNWDNNGSFQPSALPCTSNDLEGETAMDNDGDGRSDIVENDNCSDPNNASDLNFGFSKTSESFQRFNTAAENTSSEEHWLIRADKSNDPYVVRNGLKFQGNQVPQLKIRTKSEATGAFQLFWTTSDQPGFSASRSVTVSPKATNVFEELVFDMSNLNTWMGKTITQIRLDFPPDPTANRHTFIDYIHGPNASDEPCDNTPEIVFISPADTRFVEGDNLGVEVTVARGSISNIDLFLNDVLVRQEGIAPYEWGTENATQDDTALLNLAAGTYELKAVATTTSGTTVTETKIITVGNDRMDAIIIPGNFEAEAYTNISGTVRTENTPGGGENLGFITRNSYTEYDIEVTQSGEYEFSFFASSTNVGGTIEIYQENDLKGSISVTSNGSWHTYQPFTGLISLTQGKQLLKFIYKGTSGDYLYNIDRIEVSKKTFVEKTVVLNTVQDAYLDQGRRFNTNSVRVEKDKRSGYLMFNLSSINGKITNAVLEFDVFGDSGNGGLAVYEGTHNNWSETNINGQNKPAVKTQLGSMNSVFRIGSKMSIPLDISSASDNNLSLILEMLNGNDFALGSKENQQTDGPRLKLTYLEGAETDKDKDIQNDYSIYPNPVESILFISGSTGDEVIQVYDVLGALKMKKHFKTGDNTIDFSTLPSGYYLIKLLNFKSMNSKSKVFKVLKK